jgi:hypothetical protein
MQTTVPFTRVVHIRTLVLVATIAIACIAVIPNVASAATRTSGFIDKDSLSTTSTQPTLEGEAKGVSEVTISIYKEDSTKLILQEEDISVDRDDTWEVKLSEKLVAGVYDVKLKASPSRSAKVFDTETLTIKKSTTVSTMSAADFSRLTRLEQITELQRQLAVLLKLRDEMRRASLEDSSGTVTASIVPLLSGGVVTGGQSIPISYVQVRNTSSDTVTVIGFTVKQNGTAPTNLISTLTISDNNGASRATSETNPFKDGSGYVPTFAAIAPGSFKIFTIKANMASSISASIGKDFKLDVTNVETNGSVKTTYPLRGTTWSIGY